jgi:hypothetical protein
VLGATAGALVGELGNRTAVPFAAVIAGCGLGAFVMYRTLPTGATTGRRRSSPMAESPTRFA